MPKGTKDKDQFELDLKTVQTLDNVITSGQNVIACTCSTAVIYDARTRFVVAEAQIRKERAERVLRSVGLLA